MADQTTIKCPVCGSDNPFDDRDRGRQIVCIAHGGPIDVPVAGLAPTQNSSPSNGSGLWCVSVAPRAGHTIPLRNSPITDGKSRLVATLQDTIVCLAEISNGVDVVWEYRTGGPVLGSPTAAADGSLRVHSDDGQLHGISADGKPLWPPVNVGRSLSSASPLVDRDGNTWICAYEGGLLKIDAAGIKTRRPYFTSPVRFDCTGVLHEGILVVGGEDQFVHAIDLRGSRGAEIWNNDANLGRTGWYINSAIALASGPTFVAASGDDHLYGFAADGSQIWKTELPGQVLGSPVVDANDRVLVGLCRGDASRPTGSLACFDIRSRQWSWDVSAEGPVECTPVLGSDGVAYFGDNEGCIHAVSTEGTRLWQVWVGDHPVRTGGTIASPGHIVFGDDDGRLFAVQCGSPELGTGWPKYLGPAVWAPPATSSVDATRLVIESRRTTVQNSFEVSVKPPVKLLSAKPTARAAIVDSRGTAPPKPISSSPLLAPHAPSQREITPSYFQFDSNPPAVAHPANEIDSSPPVERLRPPAGSLISIEDYRTGLDLLLVQPYHWRFPRTDQREQRPLYLTNGGPGELIVNVKCLGRGATVSPVEKLRILPGRQKFVVLELEPSADEWLLLDFQVAESCPGKRIRVRIQRYGVRT
jgi:outer membrane protein assembly factor BamB